MSGFRGNKRRYTSYKEDDRFETEALSYLNSDDADKEPKKRKDGEQEISGSEESDNEAHRDLLAGDDVSDSDDEAPDDIGFHDSRQSVMTQLRSALRQVDADKNKKKEQRKKLDAQFKEQKAKKNEELSKARLSEDFFEGLDEAIPKKVKPLPKKKQITEPKIVEPESPVKVKQNKHIRLEDEDFISFTDSESGVQVANVKKIEKQSKSLAKSAADFRTNRLYGSHVRRETNQQRLSRAEKRKFVKKT